MDNAGWITGPALQTYLALGGKVSVGDWVRVISCENIEHRFITDRKYIGRALEVVAVDDHPVFAFRVGIHYPYCLCGLAAWKRKT